MGASHPESESETASEPLDAACAVAGSLAEHARVLDAAQAAVTRALRHDWRTAIVVLDIDGFHKINQAWGNKAGDAVLAMVAARLARTVRGSDAVGRLRGVHDGAAGALAHWGGDRFLAICENVADQDAARALAERLNAVLGAPITLPAGERVELTVGIGIAITGPSSGGVEDRIRDAELALRAAKRQGPGRFVVLTEEAVTDEEAAHGSEVALQRALEQDELLLHYQPKVSLQSDRIVGVEALLRWQDPQRGLVPPTEFIPLAEKTGLIVPIGAWVIERACRQVADWHDRYPQQPPLIMSVNVSAGQFGTDLVGVVAGALASAGAQPSQLCLEVTESILIADADAAVATLLALAELGVKLAIDDFGTGYSSLSYLKRFPLHELKIDKSFVDGLGKYENDTAIIAATIAMAHALGLSVVAEGVETDEQLQRLRVLGCQEVQGYILARPQTADHMARLLAAGGLFGLREDATGRTSSAAFRPARVLVVDDADTVRQLARMSLIAAGFEVFEADGGARAIEMARDLRPDCVLLDVSMPEMSGLEVCRVLRGDPATAGCKILMLTAHDSAEDKIEAFSGGADDYILKPFSPRDLVGRVGAALRRQQDESVPE